MLHEVGRQVWSCSSAPRRRSGASCARRSEQRGDREIGLHVVAPHVPRHQEAERAKAVLEGRVSKPNTSSSTRALAWPSSTISRCPVAACSGRRRGADGAKGRCRELARQAAPSPPRAARAPARPMTWATTSAGSRRPNRSRTCSRLEAARAAAEEPADAASVVEADRAARAPVARSQAASWRTAVRAGGRRRRSHADREPWPAPPARAAPPDGPLDECSHRRQRGRPTSQVGEQATAARIHEQVGRAVLPGLSPRCRARERQEWRRSGGRSGLPARSGPSGAAGRSPWPEWPDAGVMQLLQAATIRGSSQCSMNPWCRRGEDRVEAPAPGRARSLDACAEPGPALRTLPVC